MNHSTGLILLTGATGYVGGRLLPRLEQSGQRLRCLARHPKYLTARVGESTEVVEGDLLDPATLPAALSRVDTVYYLVHSMGSSEDYAERDREAALNLAAEARQAGVRRIVYLGGLGKGDALSDHLRSRQEVGRILRESGVPTLEFQASIIIGSGSLSFELIRALVEKLPVMITPRWVDTRTQPLGVEDLIAYLEAVLQLDLAESKVVEIGGPDEVSYGDLMREYARQRGLRRYMIRVPFLTPRLSSLWLGLVTPVYARVGRELVEGLRNPTVVTDDAAARLFDIQPKSVEAAIARALVNEDDAFERTRWSDALSASRGPRPWGGERFGSRLVDSRSVEADASADTVFERVLRIGGSNGYYYGDHLWQIRGFFDRLSGGPGLRRGRRSAEELVAGDALDFWRVEKVGPGRLLRLSAEMRVPGRAWLQFEVDEVEPGRSCVRQTAEFDPVGLFGQVYWYLLWPVHQFVFSGMLRGLKRAAELAQTNVMPPA